MPSLGDGPDALDLEAAIRAGRTVLFSVAAPRYGLAGQCVGAWVLLELRRVSDLLQRSGWGTAGNVCTLLVDEFSALGAQGRFAVDLLARAREAGLAVWLFTQGLADLRKIGPEVAQQLLSNTSVHGVFRHQAPADREEWSQLLGTFEREELTSRSLVLDEQGQVAEAAPARRANARWRRAPYVAPDQLRVLPMGYLYLARPGGPHRPPRLDLVLVARAPEAPALGKAAPSCPRSQAKRWIENVLSGQGRVLRTRLLPGRTPSGS